MARQMFGSSSEKKVSSIMKAAAVAGALVVLVMLLFVFALLFRSSQDTTETAVRDTSEIYLRELAQQKANQIQINFTSRIQQLNVTAKTLEWRDVANKEALNDYIAVMKEANDFDFFGIVDDAGMVHTSTGSFTGISKITFIGDGFAEPVIAFEQNIGNTDLVMFAIPLEGFSLGKVPLTAMVAGINVSTIASRATLYDESIETFCEVVSDNGAFIVQAPNKYIEQGTNLLSSLGQLAEFVDGSSLDQVKESLASDQACFVSYKVNGITHFTYMTPIEDTDWFMKTTIHYDAVSGGVQAVRETITRNSIIQLVIVVAVLVAAFALYFAMRKRNDRLRIERIQAEESNRAKSTFLSRMSHDIRTPMNAVVGFTELAMKEEGVPPKVHEYHTKIQTASNQLLMLINDILEMSRIESGKIKLNRVDFKLPDLLDELDVIVRVQAEEKHQTLVVETSVDDSYVHADKTHLSQVLLNLMSNAVKFTPEGGTIHVSCNQIGYETDCNTTAGNITMSYGIYEIRVADTGIGMTPEFIEKAFEPFEREQTSAVSGIQGTGLGLAIAKSIVEAMDDTIDIQSTPGEGTTFTLRVRLLLAEQETTEKTEESGPEAGHGDSSGHSGGEASDNRLEGKHVLLVEDNELNREIARMLLEGVGVEVTEAEDGSVAVERVMQADPGTYDLILMDIQMPVMNGYEAARAIRALDDERASIKIIAVTADAFAEDKQAAYDAGMDSHISKPIHAERLYALMRELM